MCSQQRKTNKNRPGYFFNRNVSKTSKNV